MSVFSMKSIVAFVRPLWSSHLIGILIAFTTFMAMSDSAAVESCHYPEWMGLQRQAEFLLFLPIMCVVGCLIGFILMPVGNNSRFRIIRGMGRIPILGRYCLFNTIMIGAVLLGVYFLRRSLDTSSTVESVKISRDISGDAFHHLQQEVGNEFMSRSWRGETRVYFLKTKRAAVMRALENAQIPVVE
jgi:hypothetical protein